MIDTKRMNEQLYEILASLNTPEEVRKFFDDLCTYKEIEHMAQRIEGAKLLMQGKTYNQIVADTNISTATLGRINRCIQHGNGGYTDILPKFLDK